MQMYKQKLYKKHLLRNNFKLFLNLPNFTPLKPAVHFTHCTVQKCTLLYTFKNSNGLFISVLAKKSVQSVQLYTLHLYSLKKIEKNEKNKKKCPICTLLP